MPSIARLFTAQMTPKRGLHLCRFLLLMTEIEINTIYYEGVHKELPHHSKKQDWTFQPPRSCGRKPVIIEDSTLKQAKEKLREWVGERVADGPFYLLP